MISPPNKTESRVMMANLLTRGQFMLCHLMITLALDLLVLDNLRLLNVAFAAALSPLLLMWAPGKKYPIAIYLLSTLIAFAATVVVVFGWFFYMLGKADWR
jgi:hypothetical protein